METTRTETEIVVRKRGHSYGRVYGGSEDVPLPFTIHTFPPPENVSHIVRGMRYQHYDCARCGEYANFDEASMIYHGNNVPTELSFATECQFVEGVLTEAVIDFPSGRIIISDDLRPAYDFDVDELSYGSLKGQSEASEIMASQGCVYGAVSNTSPDVYKTAEGKLVIANFHDHYDEGTEEYSEIPIPDGWTKVASVCTDLWAYSIADYEGWLSKGGTPIEEDAHYGNRTIVDLVPGKYKFTHYATLASFDWDADVVIFGELELIEEIA